MKYFAVLLVSVHIICMAVMTEGTWQQDCDRERRNGNTCELSEWSCVGSYETQTLKVEHSGGGYTRQRSRPCSRHSRGGNRGGTTGVGNTGGGKKTCTDSRNDCQILKQFQLCGHVPNECCKTCTGGTSTSTGTGQTSTNTGAGQTSTNTGAGTGAGGGNACLTSANSYRSRHQDTPNMKWDAGLAAAAKAYATGLVNRIAAGGIPREVLQHDPNKGAVGENIYYEENPVTGDDGHYCRKADASWYREKKDYNYQTARSFNKNAVGHFTQMVWKASEYVGYGVATAPKTNSRNTYAIVIARYRPQGNINQIGRRFEDYSANVQPEI